MKEKNQKKNQDCWNRMTAAEIKASDAFNAGYIDFSEPGQDGKRGRRIYLPVGSEKGF